MSFDGYKIIHVFFSHENPKSQLSLEIKTNPENEMDVQIKLKFLYEFILKEFNDNSLILVFEIEGSSLTNKITNNFNYYMPNLVHLDRPPPNPSVNEMYNARKISQQNENSINIAKKNAMVQEKSENNEMMSARQEFLKKDRVLENETNLMMNSKKYYIKFDQIKNSEKVNIEENNDEDINIIVNNLVQNMNKFKNSITEFNDNKKNDVKIELDEKPIIDYITPIVSELTPTSSKKDGGDIKEDTISDNGSSNTNESLGSKKYKIKLENEDVFDVKTTKVKKMNIEDKLLKLLNENDDQSDGNQISIQKKLNYQLRLSTAMNNISPTKNIIFIVTELMKYIDNFDLKGDDKKKLIISSIKSFLISEKVNDATVNFIINTVCPELIDILISVDKRSITIQKKISCFFPWCT